MSSYSRQQLEKYLKTINIDCNKCLDIGGSQLLIKDRVNSFNVKEYKILDLEQPHECKREPDIVCDIQEAHKIVTEPKLYYDSYDVIFCIEVSEYWYNPLQALKNINTILKKGGVLYISFHFIYPVHNPVEQDFLRYTPRGVEKLLEETRNKILEIKPRLLETNIANIDGMRPAKNYDKHDWQGAIIKAQKNEIN